MNMSNQVVDKLNQFLSDLAVFYRKVQNYHWNVKGKDFFVVHSKLEEYYDEINEQIDEVGEHILILGGEPLGSMKDYLANTKIEEAKNEKITSCNIFQNLEKDYTTLKDCACQIKECAENEKDYATSSLMDDYIKEYGKILWMIKQNNMQ